METIGETIGDRPRFLQQRQDEALKKVEEDYRKIKAERERAKKEQEGALKKTKK